MRTATTTLAAVLLAGLSGYAQAPSPTEPASAAQGAPAAPQQPGDALPAPAVPAPVAPAPVIPAPVVPPAPVGGRTFTASTGVIFNAVRPERVVDFEMVIGYLEAALQKATDPGVRAQAQGWRVFKATEPGPNGTVLYVFVIDPTVAGADYGLGRILSDAYPDQIQEIWKLYTGALAGGGSLLNLTPVPPPPLSLPPATASPLTPLVPSTRPAPPAR